MEDSTHASSSASVASTDLITLSQEISRLGTIFSEKDFTQKEKAELRKFFTVNPIQRNVLNLLSTITNDNEKLNYLKEFLPTSMFLHESIK